jgi:hypothetical protein
MREPWSPEAHPIWRWIEAPWTHPVSSKSAAVTNLDALRGHPVTEVVRWEDEEWEMFAGAGPDIAQSDIRRVPLGMMIVLDETLTPALGLKIGEGLWRDETRGEWNPWAGKQ